MRQGRRRWLGKNLREPLAEEEEPPTVEATAGENAQSGEVSLSRAVVVGGHVRGATRSQGPTAAPSARGRLAAAASLTSVMASCGNGGNGGRGGRRKRVESVSRPSTSVLDERRRVELPSVAGV